MCFVGNDKTIILILPGFNYLSSYFLSLIRELINGSRAQAEPSLVDVFYQLLILGIIISFHKKWENTSRNWLYS